MIHSDLDITSACQHSAGHFIKRALDAGFWDVFVGIASLCRFNPWHQRKTVKRDSIGSQFDRFFDARLETCLGLTRQAIDQVVVDRCVTKLARRIGAFSGHFVRLMAIDDALHFRIEILRANRDAFETKLTQST